jgi:hypothetical protein
VIKLVERDMDLTESASDECCYGDKIEERDDDGDNRNDTVSEPGIERG